MTIQVQILDEAVCISQSTNNLGKGTIQTILPLFMKYIFHKNSIKTVACRIRPKMFYNRVNQ